MDEVARLDDGMLVIRFLKTLVGRESAQAIDGFRGVLNLV